VTLRAKVLPFGYACWVGMLAAVSFLFLGLWTHPGWRASGFAHLGLLAVLLALSLCFARWGMSYVKNVSEVGHAL
jgi:hypothetical protein